MQHFTIEIAGLTRHLPIVEISKGIGIALFQMMGDVELCEAVAKKFVENTDRQYDYIITPEVKSIPLAHEISRLMGRPYIVIRKARKSYMASPISETAKSFTSTNQGATFWLDTAEAEKLNGKKVCFVDDVITTGNTIRAVESLISRLGGRVTGKFAVLREGDDSSVPQDVEWLNTLPIFPVTSSLDPDSKGTAVNKFHHRALELRDQWPVVYTAISKLMFCYRVLISKYVLEQRRVPVNPFMNFDFGFFGLVAKDNVLTANNNVVRMADELWMFGPISDGAYAEILMAKELGHPIRYFTVEKSWKIVELREDQIQYEDDVIPN